MDISLDLMYADLERLSSLYGELSSMQFMVDNPEMIIARSLSFAIFMSVLLAIVMFFPNVFVADWLSDKFHINGTVALILLEVVVFIILTVSLYSVIYWWDTISLQRDINAVTAQIEMIEARWGL